MAERRDTSPNSILSNNNIDVEAPGVNLKAPIKMPNLPKPLSLLEKKYLLAVERGDMGNVKRMLQKAHKYNTINVDCIDPLGRGAINIAIDGENLEILELLIVMGVAPNDALLQAIDVEFVEAVELLLEFEELIHKEGEPYSWEKVDMTTSSYSPDITPIILAAHRNNYEILKLLLDRGATLPMPHDIKCGCESCIKDSESDSLRFSLSRVSEYKALASPSLIALSSNDPILTAFELSWELRNLAFTEQESKTDYLELRRQCQDFAVDLLGQTRSSTELAIILNHDPDSPPNESEPMKLTRLELAIQMKQKKFVAHRNVQQLLATLWYDGLPGFRRKSLMYQFLEVAKVALLFPIYCLIYILAPDCKISRLIKKPFVKFLINASSYLTFLLLLILVSQHAEEKVIELFGTNDMKDELEKLKTRQRGVPPSFLEWIVVFYVFGQEIDELRKGFKEYMHDLWNVIDCLRNFLYIFVIILRAFAYIEQTREIAQKPSNAYIPREEWYDYDPQLVSEGMFAAANIFSALKLVHLFSINPHLGPLQISLGRMVIDIIKFFFIYTLVLFSFACGLNQLLGYFAELERKKCYSLPGELPDWDNQADACMKWRRFGNLFESSQSLFWASFGMIGLDAFELSYIKAYTRFWGLLMFGSYSVINVTVLLNLLIAMMSNSFSMIVEHADIEWKFARTRLWMSYFEKGSTLPPPFNIIPAPKYFLKLLKLRKKDRIRHMNSKKRKEIEKERDFRYTAVIRALVWRYVRNQQKIAVEAAVTEDDINEVKGEVTAMKYDILEVLAKNGMDTSSVDKEKDRAALGRKDRVWERRLMKDFHLAPVAAEEELYKLKEPPENEEPLERFRRIAKLAVVQSTQYKWKQVLHDACEISKIGRGCSLQSIKNQKNLQQAIQEAKRFMACSPAKEIHEYHPINTPEIVGGTLKELVDELKEDQKTLGFKENETPLPSPMRSLSEGILRGREYLGELPDVKITPPSPSTSSRISLNDKNTTSSQEYLLSPKKLKKRGGWM